MDGWLECFSCHRALVVVTSLPFPLVVQALNEFGTIRDPDSRVVWASNVLISQLRGFVRRSFVHTISYKHGFLGS